MLFHTLRFVLFFLPVFALNSLIVNRFQRAPSRNVLLLASLAFYMSWSVPLVGLLLLSIAINYYCARQISQPASPRAPWLVLGVSCQLGILAVFKYLNFLFDTSALFLGRLGIDYAAPEFDIILPLGISFYTFQGMSYLIDVYRGKYPPYGSLRDFALYISFFPQLVAGPIVRADYFFQRLREIGRPITLENVNSGIYLFALGVFKKTVFADNCGHIANLAFREPQDLSGLTVLLGIYAYACQIYFDFSGYTDMARGLGRMLGIELPINFHMPYLATDLRQFWRRWHISLSTWLRDYLYISLGGSRVSSLATYRNLLVTMLLGGLWHGASLTFVVWGLIHGLLLAVHRAIWGTRDLRARTFPARALAVVVTFHVVCFAWIFFRAPTFELAQTILLRLADGATFWQPGELALFKPQNWLFGLVLPLLWAFAVEPVAHAHRERLERSPELIKAASLAAIVSLIFLVSGASNEFIYFQF